MIKLKRLNSIVDHNTEYKVYINNIVVANIYSGELKNVNIKPGNYEIEIKSSEMKSNKIKFDICDGEIIEFEIKPNYDNNFFSKFITKILGGMGIKISIKSDIYL